MEHRARTTTERRFTRVAFWLILVLAWIIPCGAAQATAPSDVKCAYDAAAQTLQVTITHPSLFPTSHYIKNVEIRKEGKVILSQDYKQQPDAPAFSYTYKIQVAPGDVLDVKATCNLWGSKTVKFTVPAK
jgi:desulfoferrodoxin (superoxide reductase-like protein)